MADGGRAGRKPVAAGPRTSRGGPAGATTVDRTDVRAAGALCVRAVACERAERPERDICDGAIHVSAARAVRETHTRLTRAAAVRGAAIVR